MKKLIIYVPSFKGRDRLKFFISRFKEEVAGLEESITLHINDNMSEELSPLELNCKDICTITTNPKNIGVAGNINKVFDFNFGYEYTWILGDDDCLTRGSLARLIETLENDNPDYMFLNTITFPKEKSSFVMKLWEEEQKLPVKLGVIKSKLKKGKTCTSFKSLIDPNVDEVLLGSIMCGLFKTNLVKDFSSNKFTEGLALSVWSSYPHVINYAKSFSPDAKALYDPFIYTFNFWDGGNTWKRDYDVVVALGILYSIKCYAENNHIEEKAEEKLLKYYIRASRKSRVNLYLNGSEELSPQFFEVYPYLAAKINFNNLTFQDFISAIRYKIPDPLKNLCKFILGCG